MDPHVYPDQHVPLDVQVGRPSDLQLFEENAAVEPGSLSMKKRIWIRLAKLGGGAAPIIRLKADKNTDDNGPETVIPIGAAATTPIKNSNGRTVATAYMNAEPNGIYLVKVILELDTPTGIIWHMRIENPDEVVSRFTWVVASTDKLSKQPWIKVPRELHFEVQVGQSHEQELQVDNKGTGPLKIFDEEGKSLGTGFTLTSVPPSEIAPNSSDKLTITFRASDTTSERIYAVASNDEMVPTQPTPEHNNRVQLVPRTIVVVPPPSFAKAQQFSVPSGVPGKIITLFGKNFDVGDVKVEFIPVGSEEGVKVDPEGTPIATEIEVQVPTGVVGDVHIKVTTRGGSVVSDKIFTVVLPPPLFAPQGFQFSDLSAFPGQTITLFGNNFDVGDVSVEFIPLESEEGVKAWTIVLVKATEIQTEVPTGVLGEVHIKVTTQGGSITSDDTFEVLPPQPSFTSFSPSEGRVGDPVYLYGEHLDVGNVRVSFDFAEAPIVSELTSATQIVTKVVSPVGPIMGLRDNVVKWPVTIKVFINDVVLESPTEFNILIPVENPPEIPKIPKKIPKHKTPPDMPDPKAPIDIAVVTIEVETARLRSALEITQNRLGPYNRSPEIIELERKIIDYENALAVLLKWQKDNQKR